MRLWRGHPFDPHRTTADAVLPGLQLTELFLFSSKIPQSKIVLLECPDAVDDHHLVNNAVDDPMRGSAAEAESGLADALFFEGGFGR